MVRVVGKLEPIRWGTYNPGVIRRGCCDCCSLRGILAASDYLAAPDFLALYAFDALLHARSLNLAPGPSCFCVDICKRRANRGAVGVVLYLLAIHYRVRAGVLRPTLPIVEKVNAS